MAPATRRQLQGKDTDGTEYGDVDEMWGSKRQREHWYSKGTCGARARKPCALPTTSTTAHTCPEHFALSPPPLAPGLEYWKGLPLTVDTVLGGYARVSPSDVRESATFLESVFPAVLDATAKGLTVADCGAGVGRVTEHLLLRYFHCVDLVEPVQHYLTAAEEKLAPLAKEADPPRVVRYLCEPLQDWSPGRGRYDVVWIQWCVGHCTDDDLVALLRRCVDGLKRGGLIVVKENNCKEVRPVGLTRNWIPDHHMLTCPGWCALLTRASSWTRTTAV